MLLLGFFIVPKIDNCVFFRESVIGASCIVRLDKVSYHCTVIFKMYITITA